MSFNRSISEHGSDMLNNQDGEKFSKLDERHPLPPPPINPPPRGQRRPPPPLPPPSPTKPSLPARPPAPGMWLDKTAYTMEFSLKSYLIPMKPQNNGPSHSYNARLLELKAVSRYN